LFGPYLAHLPELIPGGGVAKLDLCKLFERPYDGWMPSFVEAEINKEAGAGVLNAVKAVR
jgi:hypothetical protein